MPAFSFQGSDSLPTTILAKQRLVFFGARRKLGTPQRLALQTIARIARQISGGLFAWHVISPIMRLWWSLASGSRRA
jgi:hypothetical protein